MFTCAALVAIKIRSFTKHFLPSLQRCIGCMSVFVSLSGSPFGNCNFSGCTVHVVRQKEQHVAIFLIDRVNIYNNLCVLRQSRNLTYLIEIRPRHYLTVSHSFCTLLASQSVSAALYDQIVASSARTSTTEEFRVRNVFADYVPIFLTFGHSLFNIISLRLHYTRLFPDPRFLLFVLQNISGYKNAVECLLQ